MVIWIIGLSASGKTTLGRAIYRLLKANASNTVFIDGDAIRRIFQHDIPNESYTLEERRKNADRICKLCLWLDKQGINVVCSILSLFEESREWNRKNYSKYFEVFIDVPLKILKKWEVKGLYREALAGKRKNVVGVDIPFPRPKNPDYIFRNTKENANFRKIAREILHQAIYQYDTASLLKPNTYFYTPSFGRLFIEAWNKKRALAKSALGVPVRPRKSYSKTSLAEFMNDSKSKKYIDTRIVLEMAFHYLSSANRKDKILLKSLLGQLVRRFEVDKKWYESYDGNWRPVDRDNEKAFSSIELYVRGAEVFQAAYRRFHTLPFLNALLKSLDILCSLTRKIPANLKGRVSNLIVQEKFHISSL